ncbi:IS110 family RNA-guided transposase [Sunxiuqinia dokdonensis]|uniref:Uncharacterized protein n=1 Tax=Sunxiuqinia dokdonensis TaxID=1409788 RepID=A0A0L8V8U1_9BACT|nr:IS110 family transposase [Sunxiuqinia dokdonensis]KOH44905.1 hypothetical protein NC99_23370 [Sunxiuqinia dokdonensis]
MKEQVKTISFEGQNIYVGIDVHLKNWVVTVMLDHLTYKTFSQNPCAVDLANYLKRNFPGGTYYSAYEAGFCGFSAHRELEAHGITNIVLNPADIPTTDKERKQKEDRRDSRKIAKSLCNGETIGIYVPSESAIAVRDFVRYRRTLVKEITRNKCRVKSLLYFHGINIPLEMDSASKYWSAKFTQWLRELSFHSPYSGELLVHSIDITEQLRSKLLKVTQQLRGILKTSPYSAKLKLLTSVPGIGKITAITLLSEIEDINRFKNLDKLCSYVGLIPTMSSSGERDSTGSITSRSNNILRSMLIESAWVAIKHDPSLALAFNNLSKRMKKNEAIVRIAKKLLSRIQYVLKNDKEYVCNVV